MFAWIKEHKLITAGLIVGVIVLWLLIRSSGKTTSAVGIDTTQNTASSDQLQAAQIQANAQIAQSNAAVQANQDTIGGQIALAQIQANSQNDANQLSYNLGVHQLDVSKDVTENTNSLAFAAQQSHDYYATAQAQQAAYYATAQQSNVLNTLAAISMHNTDAASR